MKENKIAPSKGSYSSIRIPCSDWNCTGVIDNRGMCEVCGKPYTREYYDTTTEKSEIHNLLHSKSQSNAHEHPLLLKIFSYSVCAHQYFLVFILIFALFGGLLAFIENMVYGGKMPRVVGLPIIIVGGLIGGVVAVLRGLRFAKKMLDRKVGSLRTAKNWVTFWSITGCISAFLFIRSSVGPFGDKPLFGLLAVYGILAIPIFLLSFTKPIKGFLNPFKGFLNKP